MDKLTMSRRGLLRIALSMMVAGMGTGVGAIGAGGSTPRVLTGADLLARDGFAALAGKRVGLITNHTGRVQTGDVQAGHVQAGHVQAGDVRAGTGDDDRLIDVMARAPGVTLAAILTPEHGLAGTAEAGSKVGGGVDRTSGAVVHSLYGKTLKPTPRMLAGLDVLVFDMADIGTRFYTYISTMGLAMQAAAAAGLPFMVLDRPNPLGGNYVSGFVLEKAFASFVGRFPIPIAHGLTVGELAGMIKGQAWLPGVERLSLDVVRMTGWRRDMRWPSTGRTWIATSPNIPTFTSALAYPGTGLFEASVASEGRGTDEPFLMLGHPDIDAMAVAGRVNSAGLPGCLMEAIQLHAARDRRRCQPTTFRRSRDRGRAYRRD